jgi:ATP dependent DNA ligase domain
VTQSYTKYQYLWVPRPTQKIAPTSLAFYENRGWYAQTKKNGTCTLIFANGREVIFKTRHNDDHKMWSPQEDHKKFFSGRSGWNVYSAELLHSKVTNGPKHELYIFDILVSDGEYLTGETFANRQVILYNRWSGRHEGDQVRVADRITVATSSDTGFQERFQSLRAEDEGLVLKDPNAKLKPCFKADSNSAWMVKCRIPQKNYSF